MAPYLFILAILPGILISYIVFRLDKYEHEPAGPMLLCFGAGMLVTFPAVVLEKRAFRYADIDGPYGWIHAVILAFLVISLLEEALKFLLLRYGFFPRSFFNEPFDGIVYAVLIAMGFATAENLLYADRFGLETVLLRSLTAVPAHLVFAIVQGYYAGLARFKPEQAHRLLRRGFFTAWGMHGIYDLLIIQHWAEWLIVLATASLYLSLYYGSTLIREHQENSPFR